MFRGGKSKTPDPFVLGAPFVWGLLVIACATAARVPVAMGQQALPAADQAEKKPDEPTGLSTLGDDALLTELADRGLGDLLARAMDQDKVPAKKRQGIVALLTLRNMAFGAQANLPEADRREKLPQVSAVIEESLPDQTDARLLQLEATALIAQGINPDLNTLEYWGESPRLQAVLLPMAQTVDHVLARAGEICSQRMDQLAGKITSPEDDYARRYTQEDRLRTLITYTRSMSAYAMVLSMDRASDRRKEICTSTLEALKEFDTPESTVQPVVRLQMGKLLMARGDRQDAQAALDFFTSIINQKTQPAATTQQLYEAKYFSLQVRLLAGDLDGAEGGLADLDQWQAQHIPASNPAWAQGADAAMRLLRYRINLARAAGAGDEASRQQFRRAALEQMNQLVQSQPALRSKIQRHLVELLPADASLAEMDSLVLEALVDQAVNESRKGKNAAGEVVQRGLNAATELTGRKDNAGIDAARLLAVEQARGILLEQLGKPAEAIEVYLKYVTEHSADATAGQILSRAIYLSSQLRSQSPEDPKALLQFTKVLNVAVQPPFSRVELAYVLGRVLQQQGVALAASEAYAMVPAESPDAPAARYFQIVAIGQWLDNKPAMTSADFEQAVAQVDQLAQLAGKHLQATPVTSQPAGASHAGQDYLPREYDLRSLIVSADFNIRHINQPQRAIDLLAGFEDKLAGEAAGNTLLVQALQVRVNAYMALKQNMLAAQSLVKLLQAQPGGQGSRIIYDLLQRLEKDLETAREAGQLEDQRNIATARATLSEYLVKWAAGNPDQTIRQHAYQYRLYDAQAQHQAAKLVADADQRKQLLAQSLAGYQLLATPAQVAEYQKIQPAGESATGNGPTGDNAAGQSDATAVDPHVQMGMACVMFDQGNYRQAQPILGKLLLDGKLGGPRIVNGNDIADNETYWEGTLKLYRCNIELAKADPQYAGALEETRSGLARLYIRDGQSVGGKRWHAEFEKLRAELLPEMKLPGEGDGGKSDGGE